MIIVADTTPITYLAAIGHLDLLYDLYGPIVVPQAVYDEIVFGGGGNNPGSVELQTAAWISVAQPDPHRVRQLLRSYNRLDRGEAEAITLAEAFSTTDVTLLIIDEANGRVVANIVGLTIVGTIGVLREAKIAGFIPLLRPLLDALVRNGFYVSQRLYAQVLRSVGE